MITSLVLLQVTDSIFSLVGSEGISDMTIMQSSQIIFASMDSNKDGVVTKEEFINYCQNREDILEAFSFLP